MVRRSFSQRRFHLQSFDIPNPSLTAGGGQCLSRNREGRNLQKSGTASAGRALSAVPTSVTGPTGHVVIHTQIRSRKRNVIW